jgi:hypothetical protein
MLEEEEKKLCKSQQQKKDILKPVEKYPGTKDELQKNENTYLRVNLELNTVSYTHLRAHETS